MPPIRTNSLYFPRQQAICASSFANRPTDQAAHEKATRAEACLMPIASLQVTVTTLAGNKVVGKRERLASSHVGIGFRRQLTAKICDISWRE